MNAPQKKGVINSAAVGVQCQLCGWMCFNSVEIAATCADAGCHCDAPKRLRVCPRHLPPAWLLERHPQLSRIAARDISESIAMLVAQRTGKKLPGLRRPPVRTKPGAASDTGQVALTTRARLSLAAFCDRALGLLGELFVRMVSAGERVPASSSAASGRIVSPAGNSEVVGK